MDIGNRKITSPVLTNDCRNKYQDYITTQVIDMINTLNKSNSLKSFDSFDFATLYTSIPHTLLIKCITKLIEEAYKVRSSTFISVGYRSAFWSKSKVTHCSSITSDQLITYVEYLVDNIFISIGNHVFKQLSCWNTNGYRLCPTSS